MYEFKVQDMTCGKCVKRITDAVTAVDPNAEVDCDLESKTVSIESAGSAEALRSSLIAAGYTPEPI